MNQSSTLLHFSSRARAFALAGQEEPAVDLREAPADVIKKIETKEACPCVSPSIMGVIDHTATINTQAALFLVLLKVIVIKFTL